MSHRLHRLRSVRAVLLFLAALGALACVDDRPVIDGGVAADAGEATTSTTELRLSPAHGSLRVQVDGVGPTNQPGGHQLDDVVLVGDSVLVLVADDLANQVDATLHVDGADCRRLDRSFTGPCGAVPAGAQVSGGIDAVADLVALLADDDVRPEAAVLVLANNAAVAATDLDAAMEAAGDIPRVWWVTARVADHGYQDPNNRAIEALAERDPRAGVIDWYAASDGRPDWIADLVHPTDAGQRALADLIAEHLRCDCTP